MDVASKKQLNFHFDILPRETKKAFDFLSVQNWLKNSSWYLAGGTALALQAGNRKSFDLDFFTEEKNFQNDDFLTEFSDVKEWNLTVNRKNTIYGELYKAKISFIAYPFFIPKQNPIWCGSIRVLHPIDIAVMKIIAISQRGRKRDFFDLYWCANHIESLEDIIKRLKDQYPSIVHDYHHILKSMVYFEDAEGDPEPEIYFDANWKKVKGFFRKEIPIIANKIMK